MIDSTQYTSSSSNATGYKTKVMVFVLEYFKPFSSAVRGSALPRCYNKPIITVLGLVKKYMTAIGKAYKEYAKDKQTDIFLYIPCIPDNNKTDIHLVPQVNIIISNAAEDNIQPALTPKQLEDLHRRG